MSSQFSSFANLLNRFKVPIVIAASSGFYAYDVFRSNQLNYSASMLVDKTAPGIVSPTPSIQPSLQEIVDEVKAGLNLSTKKKKALNYSSTAHPKPYVSGFYSSHSQIKVYIPDYFNITESEQLTAKAIRNLIALIGYDCDTLSKEDWFTPDGISLLNSFLLSNRAKKFVIAQSSYANFNSEYFFKHLIFTMTFTLGVLSFIVVDEKVKSTTAAKLVYFVVLLLPIIAIYYLLSGHSNLFCESKGISQAVSKNMLSVRDLDKIEDVDLIDKEMLYGAIEYYSKLLQREKAIYRLFSSGFGVTGLFNSEEGSWDPLNTELPKQSVLDVLEKVRSLIEAKSSQENRK